MNRIGRSVRFANANAGFKVENQWMPPVSDFAGETNSGGSAVK